MTYYLSVLLHSRFWNSLQEGSGFEEITAVSNWTLFFFVPLYKWWFSSAISHCSVDGKETDESKNTWDRSIEMTEKEKGNLLQLDETAGHFVKNVLEGTKRKEAQERHLSCFL